VRSKIGNSPRYLSNWSIPANVTWSRREYQCLIVRTQAAVAANRERGPEFPRKFSIFQHACTDVRWSNVRFLRRIPVLLTNYFSGGQFLTMELRHSVEKAAAEDGKS